MFEERKKEREEKKIWYSLQIRLADFEKSIIMKQIYWDREKFLAHVSETVDHSVHLVQAGRIKGSDSKLYDLSGRAISHPLIRITYKAVLLELLAIEDVNIIIYIYLLLTSAHDRQCVTIMFASLGN